MESSLTESKRRTTSTPFLRRVSWTTFFLKILGKGGFVSLGGVLDDIFGSEIF
jgi:hypothetical protein